MLWYGSYLVLWHLIGRCNPSQAAGRRRALCGSSAELIDWWCRLREMIDWLRLVRWQTMQRLAHQGAALSVTIIPDCLCSLSPPLLSPTLPVHLSIPSFGTTHTVVNVHAQTQRHIQTNSRKKKRSIHTCKRNSNVQFWKWDYFSSTPPPRLPSSHSLTHPNSG